MIPYNFNKIVSSQVTKFMSFLGIETLGKCHILKMWHVTVENLIYFHQVFALYVVKKF
jgi:hypothetical protein